MLRVRQMIQVEGKTKFLPPCCEGAISAGIKTIRTYLNVRDMTIDIHVYIL